MTRWTVAFVILAAPAFAQTPPKEDPAHDQLRSLRDAMVAAVNAGDMDKLLTHLDDDVVVTFMDAEVARKPAGVKTYLDKMLKGDAKKVLAFKTDATVDELTHLYGDTGVAFGSSKDSYTLTDGRQFTTSTRWTGTLVKKGDRWKVASFHASVSAFDNPILDAVKTWLYRVGAIGLAVGLLLGVVVGRVTKKR